METIEQRFGEWITMQLATQLYPSRVPGKRLSYRTLWRWISKGKLESRKNQLGWVFIYEPQLRALMVPDTEATRKEASKERRRLRSDWEKHRDAVLAKYGM